MNVDHHDEHDEHDGRRTAAALLGTAVIGMVGVGAMFWVFNGVVGSPAVGASQVVMATPSTGATAPPKTETATTSTPALVVPSPTFTRFTPSPVHVAPAELPTMTAPVAGQTPDPTPGAPRTASVPPPRTAPPPVAKAPGISQVSMFCRKKGDRVEGGLTFRSTTAVPVSMIAGGKISQQAAAGPGVVTVTAAGKRGSFCLATVGSQRFGPMSAS